MAFTRLPIICMCDSRYCVAHCFLVLLPHTLSSCSWTSTADNCTFSFFFFFFQAEDGIRDVAVTGVQTCALPILDAELPDMAGVELCRMLRADPRVSSSTPILLTIRDAATREQRLAALRAGAWECIAPPHDAEEILLKIGAYVHAKLDADRARAGGLLDPVTGLYNRQGLARRARELGSQAFREHGPLACIVLALDVEPPSGVNLRRSVQAIKAAARLSDVIGRLGATEFAVLAPGTDAEGARRLAERLGSSVSAATIAPAGAPPAVRLRCGYEAVANGGHAPIEPVDLLVRAAAAVRTGKVDSATWLRRFDEAATPPGSPA